MKSTLETLVLPTSRRCFCGVFLATRQQRKDGLCATCADAPAVSEIRPDVIAAYALSTIREEGLGQTLDAMTATVEAWNDCTDKEAFLNQEEDAAVSRGTRSAFEILGIPYVMPCGCYSDACYCGQYPTQAEMAAMEAEADALRPVREPMTDAEWIEAEELLNFFGNPHLDN